MKLICEKGNRVISEGVYPLASGTVLKRGQLVKLSNGLVVSASATEANQVLGISLENHPANSGSFIRVADGPTLIFSSPAPEITVTDSTTTTVSDNSLASFANDTFNNGKLVLAFKSDDSTNSGDIGEAYNISDYDNSGKTFTLDTTLTGRASVGDKYKVFPPLGKNVGALINGSRYVLTAAANNFVLKVVGWDLVLGEVYFMAGKHFFGNTN